MQIVSVEDETIFFSCLPDISRFGASDGDKNDLIDITDEKTNTNRLNINIQNI